MKRRADFGLNPSLRRQENIRARVVEARRARWLDQNAEAIREHNERVATKGVFSDGLRRW